MKSVTLKFLVTLEFSRRHCNLRPKRFDFCIEYKPIHRLCPFHYQRLELFGLLEEIGIKSNVAFLKCFSIVNFLFLDVDVPRCTSYGVYISQLIRFARASSNVSEPNCRNKGLTAKAP